jgi:hypothetical protein
MVNNSTNISKTNNHLSDAGAVSHSSVVTCGFEKKQRQRGHYYHISNVTCFRHDHITEIFFIWDAETIIYNM